MKKLLGTLVLALALCGCATNDNETKEPEGPSALATLDVATYTTELENTDAASVRVDYVYADGEVETRLTADDASLVSAMAAELKEWSLTESEDQNKIYETPTLFIDLNGVVDSNYARLAVYGGEVAKVVILTNEDYKIYDLSDETSLTDLGTIILDYYTEAE